MTNINHTDIGWLLDLMTSRSFAASQSQIDVNNLCYIFIISKIELFIVRQNISILFCQVSSSWILTMLLTCHFQQDFMPRTSLNPRLLIDRTFLHRKSHHPLAVFKLIVFGQAVQLRRLNKSQIQYTKSLDRF